MAQIIEAPSQASASRANLLLLIGSAIGLVSAAGLAWSGRAGVDVLSDVLLTRDGSHVGALGQSLVWAGCCPLGLALGGSLVIFGLHRESRQHGVSSICTGLVLLYGVLAVLGAGSVLYGTNQIRAVFFVVAISEGPVRAEEIKPATAEATGLVSGGWLLLTVAQIVLLAGCLAQGVSRSKSIRVRWPATASVELLPLWLFAVLVAMTWIPAGLAFQQYATATQLQASVVASQIREVLVMGWFGSGLLLCHALFVTVLAAIAVFRRSSAQTLPDNHELPQ